MGVETSLVDYRWKQKRDKGRALTNNYFSNKVYIYTFIMSILVVLVHSVNFASDNSTLLLMLESSDLNGIDLGGMTGASAHIENFFSNALGQAAVPGFFMMSGYMFYRNLGGFLDIAEKWKRRFTTLLVPFGAWNFIYYIIYVVMGRAGFSIAELNAAVVSYKYNPVFWYLYQLILLTLLAPVFYFLLKYRAAAFGAIILYLCFILNGGDIPFVNEDAVFYYFVGGLAARFFGAFFEGEKIQRYIIGFMLLLFFWGTQIFTTVGMQNFVISPVDTDSMGAFTYWYYGGDISVCLSTMLMKLPKNILIYILSPGGQIVVCSVRRLLLCFAIWLVLPCKQGRVHEIMKNSFFLYAVHYPIARVVIFVLEYMNVGYHGTGEEALRLMAYFATPVVSVIIAYNIKHMLKKYIPISWKMLSGGR